MVNSCSGISTRGSGRWRVSRLVSRSRQVPAGPGWLSHKISTCGDEIGKPRRVRSGSSATEMVRSSEAVAVSRGVGRGLWLASRPPSVGSIRALARAAGRRERRSGAPERSEEERPSLRTGPGQARSRTQREGRNAATRSVYRCAEELSVGRWLCPPISRLVLAQEVTMSYAATNHPGAVVKANSCADTTVTTQLTAPTDAETSPRPLLHRS